MYRLIYKSRSKKKIDWDMVTNIMNQSSVNNEKRNLTGLLLATNTHFFQILEGRFEDINSVFMRIARDDRHDNISLISFQVIDTRLFSGWGMRGIGIFDFNKDIERELMDKYGEEEGSVRFPLEEWMGLALANDIRMIRNLPARKS